LHDDKNHSEHQAGSHLWPQPKIQQTAREKSIIQITHKNDKIDYTAYQEI
jgi:hypothetical protein